MTYSIGQAAERMNLTAFTLRYYDKEGLLPFVERAESGARRFKEADFEWLAIIECLKATGMPIKDIKTFIDWCAAGDATIKQRLEMFKERRKIVQMQMEELQNTMDTIEYKCWYYETALAAGTTDVHTATPGHTPPSFHPAEKNHQECQKKQENTDSH